MHPMLNTAITAARSASKIIMHSLERLDNIRISEKSHNDFVSEVDKASEEEIIYTLHKAYPNHAILAEESGTQDGDDYQWIIDPLDGTANFIHGLPHFAVSIALKYKNRLEIGVVYDPIRDELFTAEQGAGAHLNGRRLRASQCSKLSYALIGTGFPFRNPDHVKPYIQIFEGLFVKCSGMRRAGSAALDLAYVASGRLDGFWELELKPWDMAAGALMVKEAGGFISDIHGTDRFLETGSVVAGAPKIFTPLLQAMQI